MKTGYGLLLAVLFVLPLRAEWLQHEWKLEIPMAETLSHYNNITRALKDGNYCLLDCNEKLTEAFRSLSKLKSINSIEKEMKEVSLWMDKTLHYPQPVIWKENKDEPYTPMGDKKAYKEWLKQGAPKGKINLPPKELRILLDKKVFKPNLTNIVNPPNFNVGTYHGDTGSIDIGISSFMRPRLAPRVPYQDSGHYMDAELLMDNGGTLAHELFHAVQRNYPSSYLLSPEWIIESLAEAVEYNWVYHKYGMDTSMNRLPKYDTALAKPKSAYKRGHFFYNLGFDLDGNMRYAAPIYKKVAKNDGIAWLDNYLRGTKLISLSEYYPKFIHRHAQSSQFYKDKTYPSMKISIPSKPREKTKQTVRRVASTYDEMKVRFDSGVWSNLEDKQRVYLVTVHIPKAQRIGDLTLMVDQKMHKGQEKDLSLVFAEAGEMRKEFITNVANVSKKASASKKQKFSLELKSNFVTFEIPESMCPEEKKTFKLAGISLAEFKRLEGVSLHVSDGELDASLEFTAPDATVDEVKVTLTLPTISGGSKTIELDTIEIKENKGKKDSPLNDLVGDYKMTNSMPKIENFPILSAFKQLGIDTPEVYQQAANQVNDSLGGMNLHPNAKISKHSAEDMKNLQGRATLTGDATLSLGCDGKLTLKSNNVFGTPMIVTFYDPNYWSTEKTKSITLFGSGTVALDVGIRPITMILNVVGDRITGTMAAKIAPGLKVKIRTKIKMWRKSKKPNKH